MDFEVQEVVRGKYFESSKSQRSRNRKRLRELLTPVIKFARNIGLKAVNLEFSEALSSKDEHDESTLKIHKSFCLHAKDKAFMSDKNYHFFRSQNNLQNNLPTLYALKKIRADLNNELEIISGADGKGNYMI